MAYKVGTCQGHYEFLEMLRRFCKSNALVGASTYSGTGNGTMSEIGLTPAGSNETWTVACIDTTTPGAELWSVTGSISGVQTQYTTGGKYVENDIEFKITAGGTDFILGDTFTVKASAYSGTGDGTMDDVDGQPDGVTETWTIACTDATTPGAEVWSVTGSVSGAQASATTGVAYASTYLNFTITAGGTNFAVSDQFVIEMRQGDLAASGEAWEEQRHDDTELNGESQPNTELILKGPGLSGTQEIFVGFKSYQSATSDYYNFKIAGFTGYVPGSGFSQQPGISTEMGVPLWNQSIKYWLAVNGQRIVAACKIETVYEHFYLGHCFPYGTPQQYPYPLVVGGMLTSASTTRYSETTHSFPYKGNRNNLKLRFVDGSWLAPWAFPYMNRYVDESLSWPSYGSVGESTLRDTENAWPLFPIIMFDTAPNQYGELDGVYQITGFNNAVENTVTIGGDTYVVIHDVWRTEFMDYIAIKLA